MTGRLAVLAVLLLASAVASRAGADAAPPFELAGSDGKVHKLADDAGKTVILAWFPKAFTGG